MAFVQVRALVREARLIGARGYSGPVAEEEFEERGRAATLDRGVAPLRASYVDDDEPLLAQVAQPLEAKKRARSPEPAAEPLVRARYVDDDSDDEPLLAQVRALPVHAKKRGRSPEPAAAPPKRAKAELLALALVPAPRVVYDAKLFLRDLKHAFDACDHIGALELLQKHEAAMLDVPTKKLFSPFTSSLLGRTRAHRLHHEQLEAAREILVLLLARTRRIRVPQANTRPLPFGVGEAVFALESPAVQEAFVQLLVELRVTQAAFRELMTRCRVDNLATKFLALLLSRTVLLLSSMCIEVRSFFNNDALAFLVERAVLRKRLLSGGWYDCGFSQPLFDYMCRTFRTARLVRLVDALCVYGAPFVSSTYEGGREWHHPLSAAVWKRLEMFRFKQRALPLAVPLLQAGLSTYPVLYVLEYLFPKISNDYFDAHRDEALRGVGPFEAHSIVDGVARSRQLMGK